MAKINRKIAPISPEYAEILDDIYRTNLVFHESEVHGNFAAEFAGNVVIIAIGDFPSEPLWKVYLNDIALGYVSSRPNNWILEGSHIATIINSKKRGCFSIGL